jgi:uncharacterized membrane protein
MTTQTPLTDAGAPAGIPAQAGAGPANGRAKFIKLPGWRHHPSVRSGDQLTPGERAADSMRNGMGSWAFVFAALAFLAVWMMLNGIVGHSSFDPYPFILLNLVLSCLAAMQGAILLIAAKRSDQIAAELAQHDFDTDSRAEQLIETLTANLTALRAEHQDAREQIAAIIARLDALGGGRSG